MSQLKETVVHGVKSMPRRWAGMLVAVIGLAGVTAVLVAILSLANGFKAALNTGVSGQNAVVLRTSASSELDSALGRAELDALSTAVASISADALVSGELYTVIDVSRNRSDAAMNVPLRGVTANAARIRDGYQVVQGREFRSGHRELIAGVGLAGRFPQAGVGSKIRISNEEWDVVGLFEADSRPVTGELWGDLPLVQASSSRPNNYSVAYVRIGDALSELQDLLKNDPRLPVRVVDEPEFFAEQSGILSGFIVGFGYVVAMLMAVGAGFGAVNTMYAAVASRSRELATMRAIGFSRRSLFFSVVVEGSLLALGGAALGCMAAYLIFNGYTVSTINIATFSQVYFDFAVTPKVMMHATAFCLVVGLVGSILPAFRAGFLPIAAALRD